MILRLIEKSNSKRTKKNLYNDVRYFSERPLIKNILHIL